MDFSELKSLPFGDALNAVVSEGGATTAGVFVAGFLGRKGQTIFKKPDSAVVTGTDKMLAWAYNNGPKVAAWYLLRRKTLLGTASEDVNKGIVTSVAFDTVMRLLNDGKNPATASIYGYQVLGEDAGVGSDAGTVQRLVQENSMLRSELAKRSVQVQQTPMDPRLPPYVGSSAIPPAERERTYGFMQPAIPGKAGLPPRAESRQVRYGFAGETAVMSGVGKPGAAYVQAGKMFGMQ